MGWLLMFMPWVCPGSHRCGGIQKEKVPVAEGNQICIHHSVVSYPLRVRAEMGMWTGSDWPTCKTSLQPSIFRSMPLFLTTPNCRLWHGNKIKQVMQNAESILDWAIFPVFPVFFFFSRPISGLAKQKAIMKGFFFWICLSFCSFLLMSLLEWRRYFVFCIGLHSASTL